MGSKNLDGSKRRKKDKESETIKITNNSNNKSRQIIAYIKSLRIRVVEG